MQRSMRNWIVNTEPNHKIHAREANDSRAFLYTPGSGEAWRLSASPERSHAREQASYLREVINRARRVTTQEECRIIAVQAYSPHSPGKLDGRGFSLPGSAVKEGTDVLNKKKRELQAGGKCRCTPNRGAEREVPKLKQWKNVPLLMMHRHESQTFHFPQTERNIEKSRCRGHGLLF